MAGDLLEINMAGQPAFFIMKKYISILVILSLIICCHTNKEVTADQPAKKSVVADHTGNGTSLADAVVITEKKSEQAIFVEEKAWLNEKYPGYTSISVRIVNQNANGAQKIYDVEKIKTLDGAEFEVYFDVSIFYNGQL
jgi:hypothetical protein